MPSAMASVINWTPEDVRKWLEDNGFHSYSELLSKKHQIDGKALLMMTETDLRQPPLELQVLGDIKRLSACIHGLQSGNREALGDLGLTNGAANYRSFTSQNRPRYDSELSYNSQEPEDSFDKRVSRSLRPEYSKLVISYFYMFSVFLVTSFVMVIVHDRVPDMERYPPLPDLVLDNMPYVPWAFEMCELTACVLAIILTLTLFFHKHRFIVMRRMFALTGTVFMLRCITMLLTSLSVPGRHLQCQPKGDGDLWSKLERALVIWRGCGVSLQGVRTCGDYMFSGHTVVVTMLNFFITEYTPRKLTMLHTAAWVMNIFGIFFILAAHEHYSIDVFVAFYITSRLFLYYHTLANNRALCQPDHQRTKIWFPLFSFFESNLDGMIPNEYEWPFPWPKYLIQCLTPKKSKRR